MAGDTEITIARRQIRSAHPAEVLRTRVADSPDQLEHHKRRGHIRNRQIELRCQIVDVHRVRSELFENAALDVTDRFLDLGLMDRRDAVEIEVGEDVGR